MSCQPRTWYPTRSIVHPAHARSPRSTKRIGLRAGDSPVKLLDEVRQTIRARLCHARALLTRFGDSLRDGESLKVLLPGSDRNS